MKNILIIGATSAIASACARLWVDPQTRFFLVARDADKLQAVAADLSVRGAKAVHQWPMDLRQLDAHPAMVEAALAQLGGLDQVLIAHGTLPDQRACEADPALALDVFTTNATSVMSLLTLLANVLERQGHGAIGVITSVAGDRGRASNYVYGSAKAAVSVFCEGLRARLFRAHVALTDIRPGFVDTPMTQGLALPGFLVASPETVARCIVAGMSRRVAVLYVPAFWWWVSGVIRCMPRFIFKRLRF